MASSQSFSMIHLRMSLSPEPAPPVKSGEPENTMARREPCLCSVGRTGSNLLIMCCRKSSAPSLTRGSPAPKRPAKPCLSCSRSISFCCFFQSTPKGGLARK